MKMDAVVAKLEMDNMERPLIPWPEVQPVNVSHASELGLEYELPTTCESCAEHHDGSSAGLRDHLGTRVNTSRVYCARHG